MLIELANHNQDIRRLLEKGYALRVDGAHLVVRDIPYLAPDLSLRWGAFVMKLEFVDKVRVRPDNHVVFFAGGHPYGLDCKPIANLNGGAHTLPLNKADVVVERLFSNKPAAGFPDFYEKVEHYVRLIAGPAMELHHANPLTFKVDNDVIGIGASVFKFHDTLTSRAEIGDLAALFKEEVVAIVGLGGTGAYVLDLMIKTPVKEIRGFDGDFYHVHNAFRSPGRLTDDELGKPKAQVYQGRYYNVRTGLSLHGHYVHRESMDDLKGVTFAFVCVDKGSARAQIFDLLNGMGIPYIDVGTGLKRQKGPLSGMIRTTYYSIKDAARMRDMKLAEVAVDIDDVYRQNVQIAELNALNACVAVIRYKQLRGFYADRSGCYNVITDIDGLRMYSEVAA